MSKYLISIIDDFGGSLPPWAIWQAYERVLEGEADDCDEQVVGGFLRYHSTKEARDRLLPMLG